MLKVQVICNRLFPVGVNRVPQPLDWPSSLSVSAPLDSLILEATASWTRWWIRQWRYFKLIIVYHHLTNAPIFGCETVSAAFDCSCKSLNQSGFQIHCSDQIKCCMRLCDYIWQGYMQSLSYAILTCSARSVFGKRQQGYCSFKNEDLNFLYCTIMVKKRLITNKP